MSRPTGQTDEIAQASQQDGFELAEPTDQVAAQDRDADRRQHPPQHGAHSGTLPGLALGGIVLVYLVFAAAYARFTPAWNNPDEPAHYVYIAQIAETGRLPVLERGDWDPERLEPLIRSHFPQGQATSIEFLRYESWQPPLYYLLSAPIYRLSAPNQRLTALHAFNIVLGGATLVLTYLIARSLFVGQSRWLPVLTAGALAGVPMFASTSAAINNDNLANVIGAAITLMLLRILFNTGSYRWSVLLGVVLGLGVLTKLTLGVFVPLALAALAIRALRRGRQPIAQLVREAAVVLGVMLLVMSPWLVRQGLTYGWDDVLAKRRHDAILIGRPFPSLELSYFLGWGTRLFRSAWGLFGWMQVPTSEKVYQLWSALSQLGVVGLAVYAASRLRSGRGLDLRTLTLVAVVLGAFATVLYYNLTTDVQPQGRFLFVAVGALISLLVLGWSVLLPARVRLPGLALLDVVLVLLNAYTLVGFVRPAF